MQKTLLQSRTTRAVAASTLAGGGTIVGVLAFARSQGWLPWDAGADSSVAVVLSTVVVPVVSRFLKKKLGKE